MPNTGMVFQRTIRKAAALRIVAAGFIAACILGWIIAVIVARPDPVSMGFWILVSAVGLRYLGRSLTKAFGWYRDWHQHPDVQRLAAYGNINEVVRSIEQGMPHAIRVGRTPAVISAGFLIRPHSRGIDVVKPQEVEWAYMSRTKHSVNILPIGSTYTVEVVERNSGATIQCSKREALQLLKAMHSVNPTARYGY